MTKEDLRIVFLGTPDFAVESLDAIVKNGFNVVGVVTMPDKVAGRGHKLLASPVKQYAVEHGLHLMQPANLKANDFVEELQQLNAHIFVVIAFRMLPKVVWSMPPLGTFNLHASLLPQYRGAAPINWAVINGETTTGVTTFFLKHEIDTGDIIDRVAVDIAPDENVGSLHDRLMHLGAQLTIKTLNRIIDGTLAPQPQNTLYTDESQLKPAPKIFKETCRIDWSKSAAEIHNHVRGLSPYPAAWTELHDSENAPISFKIMQTKVAQPPKKLSPGELFVVDGKRLFVGTGNDGAVEILALQPTGKKAMPTADWLRGARLSNPSFK